MHDTCPGASRPCARVDYPCRAWAVSGWRAEDGPSRRMITTDLKIFAAVGEKR